MNPGTIFGAVPVALSLLMGCAGTQGSATAPAAPADAGPVGSSGDAQAAVPVAHPFASTPLEAQSLIQEQIDAHIRPLWKCVNDLRATKGHPHEAVTVDIGIDQEGNLLGVVSSNPKRGDLDPVLKACMMTALHGLPFPRSHAGIITVRQTFTDVSVTP